MLVQSQWLIRVILFFHKDLRWVRVCILKVYNFQCRYTHCTSIYWHQYGLAISCSLNNLEINKFNIVEFFVVFFSIKAFLLLRGWTNKSHTHLLQRRHLQFIITICVYLLPATSSKDDIHRRIGGRCSTNNMKVVFKVCCRPEDQQNNQSEYFANNISQLNIIIRRLAHSSLHYKFV